jgi:hypothetical protein
MPLVSALAEHVPDRAFATALAFAHLRFEPVLGRVRTLVSPRRAAIDVGAWYGPWTHWLARACRNVVAVEPNPDLAQFLTRTAPSNVRVVAAAASDAAGTAELWLPVGGRGTEGRASLSPQRSGCPGLWLRAPCHRPPPAHEEQRTRCLRHRAWSCRLRPPGRRGPDGDGRHDQA